MGYLIKLLFTQPLFNLLIVLDKAVGDFGVAIILLTILIRFLLYPLFYKALKNQALMQKIQPELSRIQKEHKDNKEKQATEMMALWKKHQVNPFSGFLLILVQLPILVALYQSIRAALTPEGFSLLYSFVAAPAQIQPTLLGILDLAASSWLITILAALAQYVQGWLSVKKMQKTAGGSNPSQAATRFSAQWLGPILTLLIFPRFPAALGLYWFTSSLFSAFQQYLINKRIYGGDTGAKS